MEPRTRCRMADEYLMVFNGAFALTLQLCFSLPHATKYRGGAMWSASILALPWWICLLFWPSPHNSCLWFHHTSWGATTIKISRQQLVVMQKLYGWTQCTKSPSLSIQALRTAVSLLPVYEPVITKVSRSPAIYMTASPPYVTHLDASVNIYVQWT